MLDFLLVSVAVRMCFVESVMLDLPELEIAVAEPGTGKWPPMIIIAFCVQGKVARQAVQLDCPSVRHIDVVGTPS